ncbi:hypothetical protein Adu01nite_71680 [Paractinoplanes durhamensis]|uniref:Uncharacterized protein n=1 Tax=Paractinoplanes durhamensis TaxID=113563 RepID=A0ABQ3Z7L8_9ACTN|nr:hypothetical protein Adu01nite_71680 [Actinoplanes durhamensis]
MSAAGVIASCAAARRSPKPRPEPKPNPKQTRSHPAREISAARGRGMGQSPKGEANIPIRKAGERRRGPRRSETQSPEAGLRGRRSEARGQGSKAGGQGWMVRVIGSLRNVPSRARNSNFP